MENPQRISLRESLAKIDAARNGSSSGNKNENVMVKEAKKKPGSSAPVLKRPSASKQDKVLKRPAASNLRAGREKNAKAMKVKNKIAKCPYAAAAAAKLEVLRKHVPLAQLNKFEQGCSRCRFAPHCTPSCWRHRGFDI